MNTGQRLREFIKNQGLTQDEFGEKIGKSRTQISNLVNNRSSITKTNVKYLTSLFPLLNINWLLTGEGNMLLDGEITKNESKQSLSDRLYNDLKDQLKKKDRTIDTLSSQLSLLQGIIENGGLQLGKAKGIESLMWVSFKASKETKNTTLDQQANFVDVEKTSLKIA